MKKFFNYWTKTDRSDQKTIDFESFAEFSRKLSENSLEIHDGWRFENDVKVGKTNHYYAFPSKISGKFCLEWYTNLNVARLAQKELLGHLKRAKK